MKLHSATRISAQILSFLGEANIKAEIVGGVYKGKPNPHDIDIVVELTTTSTTDFFYSNLCNTASRRWYISNGKCELLHKSELKAIKDTKDTTQLLSTHTETIPIEFYLTTPEHYTNLKKALRSSRWQVIKGKMMAGLRYRKLTFLYLVSKHKL